MTKTQEEMVEKKQSYKTIDCDVHNDVVSFSEIIEYLDDNWKDYARSGKVSRIGGQPLVVPVEGGMRMDSFPPEGGPAGSSPQFMKKQLLDEYDMEAAVLYPHSGYQISSLPQNDWATAVAKAYNDWTIDKWLSYDSRFKGSILVAAQDPKGAAREIDRLGSHPDMIQVGLGIHSPIRGYGDEYYDPIWEAAVRNNLVCTFHVSLGSGLYPYHFTGAPRSFVESQSLHGLTYQGQMASLIFGGVFDKFPDLNVAFIEGGFSWVPHMMFTLDTHWSALRREVPWVKRFPSEYIKEHFWIGTQPFIKTSKENLEKLVEMIGADRLVYASDYPHWEFDSPTAALNKFPKDIQRKILHDNPKTLYGF